MNPEYLDTLVGQARAASEHVRAWHDGSEGSLDTGLLLVWIVALRRLTAVSNETVAEAVADDLEFLEEHRVVFVRQIADRIRGLALDELREELEAVTRTSEVDDEERLFDLTDGMAQLRILDGFLAGDPLGAPVAGAARALVSALVERAESDPTLLAPVSELARARMALAGVGPGHPEFDIWDTAAQSAGIVAELEADGPLLSPSELKAFAARVADEAIAGWREDNPPLSQAARAAERVPWTLGLRMAFAAIREAVTLAPVHGFAGTGKDKPLPQGTEDLQEATGHPLYLRRHGRSAWLEWEGPNPPDGLVVELEDGRSVELARWPEFDEADGPVRAWSWLRESDAEEAVARLVLIRS